MESLNPGLLRNSTDVLPILRASLSGQRPAGSTLRDLTSNSTDELGILPIDHEERLPNT